MTIIAVASGKGAPGVTTTAFALAAVWPRPSLFAECDGAGGDLPYLFAGSHDDVSSTRGAMSYAAAARLQSDVQFEDHLQLVHGSLPVFVGPASRAQAVAMGSGWTTIANGLARMDGRDVIVDLGAFVGDDIGRRLVSMARLTVLVCRPTVASVAHTRDVLVALGRRGDGSQPPRDRVGVAVVGDPADVREVGRALAAHALSFVTPIAYEPAAAEALFTGWSRRLDRSRLLLDIRALARLVSAPAITSPDTPLESPVVADTTTVPAEVGA